MDTVALTMEMVEAGMKSGVGLNKHQAKLLGVKYPLSSGWKNRLIGKQIPVKDYELFLALNGVKGQGNRIEVAKGLGNQEALDGVVVSKELKGKKLMKFLKYKQVMKQK